MISMIAPSGGTTFPIEIDIMEFGISAIPFGEFCKRHVYILKQIFETLGIVQLACKHTYLSDFAKNALAVVVLCSANVSHMV